MTAHTRTILLSIAVPTKNRQSYLINLIDELLLSPRTDFEIVINDNSSDDSLRYYVENLGDSRVQYSFVPGWISVVDNCDAALRACRGYYICMLGDDDGLMLEEALGVLEDARKEADDAVVSTVLLYSWPDITHKFISNMGGKLRLSPSQARRDKRRVDDRASLRRVISRGGALGFEGLPCVYHGFISRRALLDLHGLTGSYFPGASPDMANAIGVSRFIHSCRHVSKPLVISGHSYSSGGGRGNRRDHRGEIKDQAHLPADTVATWHAEIPFFWSGPTIYAQSLRQALGRTGVTEFGQPGTTCVYAACFLFEGGYSDKILAAIRTSGRSLWVLGPKIAFYALIITFHRTVQFLKNMRLRLFPGGASLEAGSMAEAIRLFRARSADSAVGTGRP